MHRSFSAASGSPSSPGRSSSTRAPISAFTATASRPRFLSIASCSSGRQFEGSRRPDLAPQRRGPLQRAGLACGLISLPARRRDGGQSDLLRPRAASAASRPSAAAIVSCLYCADPLSKGSCAAVARAGRDRRRDRVAAGPGDRRAAHLRRGVQHPAKPRAGRVRGVEPPVAGRQSAVVHLPGGHARSTRRWRPR